MQINPLHKYILALFNQILRMQEIPLNWSEGKIIPIYKKVDRLLPENYHSITLLNSIPKYIIFNYCK